VITLTTAQVAALRGLDAAWHGRTFVLIGASALGHHFPGMRSTVDLDLTTATFIADASTR